MIGTIICLISYGKIVRISGKKSPKPGTKICGQTHALAILQQYLFPRLISLRMFAQYIFRRHNFLHFPQCISMFYIFYINGQRGDGEIVTECLILPTMKLYYACFNKK